MLYLILMYIDTKENGGILMRRTLRTNVISGKKFDIPVLYQPKSLIGEGAYGQVLSATNLSTNTNVAIKKMSNIFGHPVLCKRAIREVKLLKQLNHPNIIQITDLSMDNVCKILIFSFQSTSCVC